ncbi:MAG TPA: hypothetical protein VHV82_04330 [Sporichthyaceae bacterium]|jgi:hypothetical protein|nr:hypothetical protein [Sporichthyaceae bacterium]
MKTETTTVDNEPHGFEDLPWRIGYRVKRGLFHVFGPPTLNDRNNPHLMLERERAARYAHRRPAATESAA